VSAADVLSDRFAIHSAGEINVMLSAEDMVECDKSNFGCNGGDISRAWDYLTEYGIVSDECLPMLSEYDITPECHDTCVDPNVLYTKYKCAPESKIVCSATDCIKNELHSNGPMQTLFEVY